MGDWFFFFQQTCFLSAISEDESWTRNGEWVCTHCDIDYWTCNFENVIYLFFFNIFIQSFNGKHKITFSIHKSMMRILFKMRAIRKCIQIIYLINHFLYSSNVANNKKIVMRTIFHVYNDLRTAQLHKSCNQCDEEHKQKTPKLNWCQIVSNIAFSILKSHNASKNAYYFYFRCISLFLRMKAD